MKKFIIQSKQKISILEVECEKLSIIDDMSIMQLKPGEWKAKINKPISLFEKDNCGKLVPPVWCWHSFYETIDECTDQIKDMVRTELFRDRKKYFLKNLNITSIEIDEEEINKEIADVISKVEVVYLKC